MKKVNNKLFSFLCVYIYNIYIYIITEKLGVDFCFNLFTNNNLGDNCIHFSHIFLIK
jgi:hypothetical protein